MFFRSIFLKKRIFMCFFLLKSQKSVAVRSFCLFDTTFFVVLYSLAAIYNLTLVDRKNRERKREDDVFSTKNY